MTLIIARHEFAQIFRDGRFRWAIMLIFGLLLTAVVSGWHFQDVQAKERAYANQIERERWLGQGMKNPHGAAHDGIYVFQPVSSVSAIEQGIQPYVGIGAWLEAHKMTQFVYRPVQDATPLARLGELTAAVVLQVLLPLLVIVLSFGVFAFDRESGRLRQILSLGVPSRSLVAGKLLGVAGVMGVVLVPAAVLATVVVMGMKTAGLGEVGLRFGLLMLTHLVYLGIVALIALAVSAWASTARQALVVLLGFWIIGCLVVPRLSGELVGQLHPIPSRAEFNQRLSADMAASHDPAQALRVRDRVMKEYGVTRPEDLPIDWRGISLQEGEEANYPVFDRLFSELFDRYRSQDRILQWTAVFSPLLATQSLSHALAGTDFEHHRRFLFAAEEHRRVMQKILNGDVTLHDREGTDYQAGREIWEKIPPFVYHAPSLTEILPHYFSAILLLAGWLVFSVGAALRATVSLKP